ncbi:glycosyltransferase family 2 protein [Leptospira sp. 'Mane']|uniref:glycosyltransferase family 2 protein n=1 Tax=Leptospira sp. 'Mane' TaxID=3387407 RepID=UPI00398BAFD6
MDNVYIILSTFNGEKFLEEQLLSLKNQSIPFHLLVRDDGSSDRTSDILSIWKDKLTMKFVPGKNVGVIASFGLLLQEIPKDANYIFFCDQDDVWESDKLEKSIHLMKKAESEYGKDKPFLFHSDLSVINDESKLTFKSFWKFQNINWRLGHRLNRLIMQNTVTGCTSMINSALLRLVEEIPSGAKMHDWWLALVACSFGKIITTEEPLIRYRIHQNNVVGGKSISVQRVFKTLIGFITYIRKWKLENKTRVVQVESFYSLYQSSLPMKEKEILERFISVSKFPFLKRKIFQCRYGFFQQGWYRVMISFFLF